MSIDKRKLHAVPFGVFSR